MKPATLETYCTQHHRTAGVFARVSSAGANQSGYQFDRGGYQFDRDLGMWICPGGGS